MLEPFMLTGNPELDKSILEAFDSGDIDRVEKAIDAGQREFRRKEIAAYLEKYRGVKEHAALHAALSMWFERAEAQHEPRVSEGAKGDLIRWAQFEGCRLPTIRRDLVGAAQTGKIELQGAELFCALAVKLEPAARKWLIQAFESVSKVAKAEQEKVQDAIAQAFIRAPVSKGVETLGVSLGYGIPQ